MEKFDSKKHKKSAEDPPFAYVSSLVYLDFNAYTFARNGENLIVWQDIYYPHNFPSIFLPKNKLNWRKAEISFVTKEDMQKIKQEKIEVKLELPSETEYFYKTEDFLKPQGKLKQRARQFEKSYSYRISHTYPPRGILLFYDRWKKQRSRESELLFEEDEQFFLFCLKNFKKYDIRQIYIEADKKLIGLAWGVSRGRNWVGLHLKADYTHKGLSRFLHCKRAELFSDKGLFTLGTGVLNKGIAQFKQELRPSLTKEYHYILTD